MVEENRNTNKSTSFKRQKKKEEMQKQLISYGIMILFTIIAFTLVATEAMEPMFVIPILILLALVQVGFQLYYFMHLKDKGHTMPAVMMYGGIWAALLSLAALGVITWW